MLWELKNILCFTVNPENTVLFTAREREKTYLPEQDDPEVVQPYAAYSPAGNVKVCSLHHLNIHFTVHGWLHIIL